MSHRTGRFQKRATTLIELLVVMAVIGILIAMLIPSLKRSMTLASSTICAHNLRSVGQALYMYQTDYDGWLPTKSVQPISAVASTGADRDSWFQKMFPTYLNDPMILTCPEDPFRYRMAQARNRLDDPEILDYPSYGLNNFIMTAAGGNLADLDQSRPARPPNTILAADMGPDGGAKASSTVVVSGPKRNRSYLAWDDGYDPLVTTKSAPWLTTRHNRGINVLTLDGGVRQANTRRVLARPIKTYYYECAWGGCTLCVEVLRTSIAHYSFMGDSLYWWTGPIRVE